MNRKTKSFDHGDIARFVRASCAVPVVFHLPAVGPYALEKVSETIELAYQNALRALSASN